MSNTNNIQKPKTDDAGFSVEKLLNLAKIYFWELLKYSWVIAALAIVLGYYMYQSKKKIPVQFTAFLNFSLNESSGADQSFMQQVLGGSLGIGSLDPDLGLGQSGGMPMLQELIKTRKTLELVLFQKVNLPNKKGKYREDYFINHIIELNGYRELWSKTKSSYANIYFKNDSTDGFSRDQNYILLTVCNNIIKGQLSDAVSKAGILTLKFKSFHEELSYHFLLRFYKELNTYYTQKSVEKQRRIFLAARIRRDSLEKEMDRAEKGYISYLNTHNLAAMGQHAEEIEIQYLGRKLSGEMEAYFMAIRNVEAAKIALEQQTPLLQAIDKPIYPLSREAPNAFMALITGLAIGTFLGIALIVGKKALRDYMKSQKKEKEKEIDVILEPVIKQNLPTP
jgi:hypothetical protein